MQRWIFLGMLTSLLPSCTPATTAGSSWADTRYFYTQEYNLEYMPNDRRPTRHERVLEVTGYWREFLQAYRAVEATPAARKALRTKQPHFQRRVELRRELAIYGISSTMIARQPTAVYTVQLGAYRQPSNVRRFLARLPHGKATFYFEGTQIYRMNKRFRFGYGDESANYKGDPLYLVRSGGTIPPALRHLREPARRPPGCPGVV
ncbi:MAG: hypothetical protein ACYDBB_23035 [Armatimonadota bacterium]